MCKPHTTVHGIPGIGYTRRAYREGQIVTGTDDRRYMVTLVRNDGDVFGDGCTNFEVWAEPATEPTRVCHD